MTNQVYTIGYSGRKPEEVKQIACDLGAVLFDIRFSPRSRIPQWAGSNVKALVGAGNYLHMKALGNANYKVDGPIAILDYNAGRLAIEQSTRPVILMCACTHYATCHRATVANMLQSDGFTVEEIGVKPAPARKPALTQRGLFDG